MYELYMVTFTINIPQFCYHQSTINLRIRHGYTSPLEHLKIYEK